MRTDVVRYKQEDSERGRERKRSDWSRRRLQTDTSAVFTFFILLEKDAWYSIRVREIYVVHVRDKQPRTVQVNFLKIIFYQKRWSRDEVYWTTHLFFESIWLI